MPFFGRALESLTEQDLQSLLDNEVTEGKDVDYKEALSLATGDEKKEFLHDVTSFANTAGGHLLIGIKADGNRPVGLSGLAMTAEQQDQTKLQIENLVRDSVDPRLPPLQARFVKLQSGRHVLVVRVVQSWAAPHMVRTSSKFFARNSSGKFWLDTQQLRAAFAATEDMGRRMGAWKTERIGKVLANEAPHPLPEGAKVVAHLLPQQSFVLGAAFDALSVRDLKPLNTLTTSGLVPNLDGASSYILTRDPEPTPGYVQVFRNGCVECVDTRCLEPQSGDSAIPGRWVEDDLIQFVRQGIVALRELGIGAPLFASCTLVGVRGYRLANISRIRGWNEGMRLRHNVITLPDVMFDDGRSDDIEGQLRPAFDVLANAFGLPRSPNYGENGERLPRPR